MVTGSPERVGLLFAALCAANGAFVPAVAKLTTEHAAPLFVVSATAVFGGAAATVVLAVRRDLAALIRRETAGLLILLGALGTALPYLLFFVGTRRTTAIEAVVCLQIEPAYSLALAWLVLGHRLTVRRVASAAVLLAGIALAVGFGPLGDPWGIAMLLATPLCWQLSHLLVLRRLPGLSPEVLTGARYVYGALILTLAAAAWGGTAILPDAGSAAAQLPVLAFQGVVLFYLGTMLWYQTLARMDLSRATAIVVPSIPLLSLGASFLIVGEVPSLRQAAGMLLTAAGVLSFVRAPHAVEVLERVPTQTAPLAAEAEPGGDEA